VCVCVCVCVCVHCAVRAESLNIVDVIFIPLKDTYYSALISSSFKSFKNNAPIQDEPICLLEFLKY